MSEQTMPNDDAGCRCGFRGDCAIWCGPSCGCAGWSMVPGLVPRYSRPLPSGQPVPNALQEDSWTEPPHYAYQPSGDQQPAKFRELL